MVVYGQLVGVYRHMSAKITLMRKNKQKKKNTIQKKITIECSTVCICTNSMVT